MKLRALTMTVTSRPLPPIGPGLPPVPLMVARERKVSERFGLGGALRSPPDIEEIRDRLVQALQAGTPLLPRDLRYAPQCIWLTEQPIAGDPALLKRLLKIIARAGRRSLVRNLASAYFRMMRPGRPGIVAVGRVLDRLVTAEFGALYDLKRDHDVFNPEKGPRRVAERCFAVEITPQTLLRPFGLRGQALSGGFGEAVFQVGMTHFRRRLERSPSEQAITLILAWADETGEAPFASQHTILAQTLLLPFSERDPAEAVKDRIVDALLERVGDPRTKPARWVQMTDAAAVLRRWLTRQALRQFLDIVDEIAKPNHWEYRRAFWMALYEQGAIQEAWVAFGPNGVARARSAFGEQASFGLLEGRGKPVEPGHAVLLMRIGDLTIIDWSHNGRCVAWLASDPTSPKLYLSSYLSGALAPYLPPEGGMEQKHQSSDKYSWQQTVADFIYRKTRYHLQVSDYRVK